MGACGQRGDNGQRGWSGAWGGTSLVGLGGCSGGREGGSAEDEDGGGQAGAATGGEGAGGPARGVARGWRRGTTDGRQVGSGAGAPAAACGPAIGRCAPCPRACLWPQEGTASGPRGRAHAGHGHSHEAPHTEAVEEGKRAPRGTASEASSSSYFSSIHSTPRATTRMMTIRSGWLLTSMYRRCSSKDRS